MKFEVIKCEEDQTAYETALCMIEDQGNYKEIGSGSYGKVFGAVGSNIVYKIGRCYDNKPYLSYVENVIKNAKGNPFAPKIYGVRIYEDDYHRDNVFVVAMERLCDLPGRMWYICDEFEEVFKSFEHKDKSPLGIKRIIHHDLVSILKIIKQSCRKSEGYTDFHDGNFMMRGKQVVVIDPIC